MISTNPFSLTGDAIGNIVKQHLAGYEVRNLTLENFVEKRVRIKSFHNEIISLKPKPIQLFHQQQKINAVQSGKKPRFLLLKYRRGGFTTWEQATSYRCLVTKPNTTCVTLADTIPNTKTIFRMVSLMANLDLQKPPSLTMSKVHVEVEALNSMFHIGTAGARAFGRGDNLTRVHGSECAWWQGGFDMIDNLVAGLTEAARHGEVILETTANGASGWFYDMYSEAMAGGNTWTPLFYAWFMDEENQMYNYSDLEKQALLDTLTDEEVYTMDINNLTVGQMLWRRDKQLELKRLFKQEYPENWTEAFLIRGTTFFDTSMLDELSKTIKTPLHIRDNVLCWIDPIIGREYSAGADVAEGNIDSDNSVMGILDKETGEQVAVLRGKWRPDVFARKCIELCKHYNNALFACEINNHGHSVMNTVMNTLGYNHLYYRLKPIDKDKYGVDKKERIPGWHTNHSTRPLLLDNLNEALEHKEMIVNDHVFLNECKTFVDDGGRYEADAGKHDDSVIAWGIALQCKRQRKKSFEIC